MPDGSFQILKTPENKWVMPERSNYPISQSALLKIDADLKAMTRGELATQDPTKFDNFGVGEPKEFGQGTAIEFFDMQGQIIVGKNIGQFTDNIYVRNLGEMEVYNVIGKLPPISQKSTWLDLDVIKIAANLISQIEVSRSGFSPFIIRRAPNGEFALNDGELGPRINSLGSLLASLKFEDVTNIQRINSRPLAVHKTTLTNGAIIEITLFRHFRQDWVKISAISSNAQNLGFAEEFNARTKDWAFVINEFDASLLKQQKDNLLLRGTLH